MTNELVETAWRDWWRDKEPSRWLTKEGIAANAFKAGYESALATIGEQREAVAGYAEGIEAAATLLDEAAQDWNRIRDPGMANNARAYAKRVRTLASAPPAPVSELRVKAAARNLLTSLDADNDLTNPEQVNAYCALEAALVSEPTAAHEGWRDISELPRDTDNTYLVCVENVGGTGTGPGWVEKGFIDPGDARGWFDDKLQPIERGPWKVTKFMPWPALPAPQQGGADNG